MKRLFALCVLLCALPAFGQWTIPWATGANAANGGGTTFTVVEVVQPSSQTSCGSGLTATFGTNTTAGEGIFLEYYGGTTGTAMTITDSASQTYTKSWELTNVATHYAIGFAYFLTSASGVSYVKITNASDTSDCHLIVTHVKRSSGSWAVDQTGAASSTGVATPWSSPGITTTSAYEILFGGAMAVGTAGGNCAIAASGSWTGVSNTGGSPDGNGDILLYQTVTTTQTNIKATGTTGTCTTYGNAGNYPGIVSFS